MVVFQLGGSVPAIATALQLSAFSLMWPPQHRNPPLIGKIRKLQIIKKDLVFVCCRAEQGGKVLLSARFICWWWLAEIGRKGAISQPLSSLLHPPHCCFTHFKYKDKDTEKDKYKVLQRPNVCYIFEEQGVQGFQIWHGHGGHGRGGHCDLFSIFNCILLYSKWDRVITGHF